MTKIIGSKRIVDVNGRVQIPAALRDELGIRTEETEVFIYRKGSQIIIEVKDEADD
jgi:AbrB family looped-hinge helix DNA binding protein